MSPWLAAHELLIELWGDRTMSLVRLLGFRTLTCGCVVGRYRELATSREVSYVEEKGGDCDVHVHRRNHTIPDRVAPSLATVATLRASSARTPPVARAPRVQITVVPPIPEPHIRFTSNGATFSFYLGDCVDILERLPPGSIDAIVTSPPYSLGIRYRSYDDTMPRSERLAWTADWVSKAARALAPDGSLFLNVGAKPTDPWTAIDVAQPARPYLHLQNTIHWIKSIAIEKALAGTNSKSGW